MLILGLEEEIRSGLMVYTQREMKKIGVGVSLLTFQNLFNNNIIMNPQHLTTTATSNSQFTYIIPSL